MTGRVNGIARERCARHHYDAIVVGAGPNGLAAAITLARAGRSTVIFEAESTVGGGCRSAETTLPGFIHDLCSAIHPLGIASPFFQSVELASRGLEWILPPVQFAQPLDNAPAALAHRSVALTSSGLGRDGAMYDRLMSPLVDHSPQILSGVLGPLRPPRHPRSMAKFGIRALPSARLLATALFREDRAPALLAGVAAHSELPLTYPTTAGTGLLLAMLAHAVGWPVPRGGSQRIADILAGYFRELGGEIVTEVAVESLDDLPSAGATLFDVTPRQLLRIAGDRFPPLYRWELKHFRYGPGVFKVDYALSAPIPWRDRAVAGAGTVHLGGTLAEVAASEAAVARGQHPTKPFVLVAQQSLFDSSRAPAGKHTGWAYCHVPNGSTIDMTEAIERQIERFAPGFRDTVLHRHVTTPAGFHAHNANYVGGDINGGAMLLRQIYTRPAFRLDPYATPAPGIFICSSSTPPAGGVHGMCGYWAARSALGDRVYA